MRIGYAHNWRYHGHMKEKKTSPGTWRFFWRQKKYRAGTKYMTGTPVGTRFYWYLKGRQMMKKVSPNSYSGYFKGVKRLCKRSS